MLSRWSARLRTRLQAGTFARSVGILVGGTAIGHAITAATMPILTRLYSPADFGVLATFSSAFAIIVVAVCLRYEIAIPIARTDEEAANLLAVAASAATFVSGVVALAVLPMRSTIAGWLGQPALAAYLWMLPVCTCLAGLYAALQFWFVRRRQFGTLARTRVAQSTAASGSQIALAFTAAPPFGLLAGPVVSNAAGCVGTLARLSRNDRGTLRSISLDGMRHAAHAGSKFPLYSTGESLANSAAIHLPVMLIAALGSSAEAGQLMLAMFVVQAPIALIGNAISQVYLSRAPEALRSGELRTLTASVINTLARTGVGPLLFLGIIAPFVFESVFGPSWSRAGLLVSWLVPWFVVQFITTPVSMVLHVASRQRDALLLQLGGLLFRVGAVAAAYHLPGNRLTEAYAVSGLGFYVVYLTVIAWASGCSGEDLMQSLRDALPVSAAWLIGGIAVGVAFLICTIAKS